mgnify:CR=1 FL=1
MTDDLVTRARQYEGQSFETTACYNGLRDELAARIEADAATIARLEGELHLAKQSAQHSADWATAAIDDMKAADAKVAALVEALCEIKREPLGDVAANLHRCRMVARAAIAAAKEGK